MLWRSSGSPESSQALDFDDVAAISDYAITAVSWASEKGVMSGYGDGTLIRVGSYPRTGGANADESAEAELKHYQDIQDRKQTVGEPCAPLPSQFFRKSTT